MATFLIRRALQTVLAVWVLGTIVFFLVYVAGDPISLLTSDTMMSTQEIADLRRTLGLDQPLHIQYVLFVYNLVQGDFGVSYYSGRPALDMVLERFPATLYLVFTALAIALVVGIPLGIIAAVRAGSWSDFSIRFFSVLGISAPTFWIAIVFIFIFSVQFRILPSTGMQGWQYFILPGVTLALFRIAFFTRMIRSTLLDVFGHDYIRTARSKGLHEVVVTYKHSLKNALIPFVTIVGLEFGHLLAGAVVTETIFAWPGMNRLALTAMYRLDYPVILAYAIVVGLLFATINLIVDIIYAVIDPRIRY